MQWSQLKKCHNLTVLHINIYTYIFKRTTNGGFQVCWKLDSSRNVWFFGRELYTAALWPPVLRTCQTAPAPQQPLTLSHQSNISSLYLSPFGGPKVTEACVTVELRGVIDLRREKWLLSTSETATLERGAELWPAGLANADPSYRSNYQLCQIPPSASLLFSLSLSLYLFLPPILLSPCQV